MLEFSTLGFIGKLQACIIIFTTVLLYMSGLLIFRGKKAKFRGIFRGKFAEKSADFAGFSREKSQTSRKNRPISQDFRGRKVKIRRKSADFAGFLVEKSQITKDFQGQILRKIGRFHGKFWGETSPRNNRKKQPISLDFFGANLAKIDQFCVDMTSVF